MKGPKPLIEEHYYIQELIERQEKRHDDRTYSREKKKELEEKHKDIIDAKDYAIADFLCRHCGTEFRGVTVKQVSKQFDGSYFAFYRHKCECGRFTIRHITDKHKDPYWVRSKTVIRDRGLHFRDMVQPFQTGYNLLYGKPK